MRRSAEQTNDLILDAAYGLFRRQGFLRVSMDQIAERANLAKRTLYQRFRSKDDLIAATLAHASKLALVRLESIKLPTNRDAMIDSLFAQIADWAATPRWSGAGFTRVVVELADLRGHPARGIARQHKTALGLVYPPPRVGKGFIAAQTGSRNHSADGGRDDAHAYSWRSQLC
jgi:AcrR family transcriptional regulator